jgi:hypothetical protein
MGELDDIKDIDSIIDRRKIFWLDMKTISTD